MRWLLTGFLILVLYYKGIAQLYFGARTDYALPVASTFVILGNGDYNEDGVEDLVVSNFNGSSVSIFIGLGGGTFASAVNYPTTANPGAVTSLDVNGDSHLDLSIAMCGGSFNILMGSGTGTFGAPQNYAAGNCPQYAQPGDFNEDGKVDFVAANYLSSNFSIHFGDGTGAFPLNSTYPTGTNPGLAATDLNQDKIGRASCRERV